MYCAGIERSFAIRMNRAPSLISQSSPSTWPVPNAKSENMHLAVHLAHQIQSRSPLRSHLAADPPGTSERFLLAGFRARQRVQAQLPF